MYLHYRELYYLKAFRTLSPSPVRRKRLLPPKNFNNFLQARALFREEELPQEEAASLPLPALLARVRAMASERRAREAELEEELSSALAALGEARRVEGDSRGLAERLRSEAEEAIER